jgi:hypothetical protein
MTAQSLLAELAMSAAVVFLFVVSLLGLALGLSLLLRASAALPFMALMNRWISTRRVFTPLEAEVRVPPPAGNTRWFGLVLMAIGLYAAVVLTRSFDVPRLAALFKFDPRYSLAGVGLETLKWVLVAGAVAAVAAGVMLLFFPRAWRSFEARANRWYSTRELELAGDTLHMSLDRVVEAHPRAAGGVLFALSLLAALASGLVLFPRL